ncbi:MAG: hypothetical protein ACKO1O_05120 [Erythrobacter sp.]
MNEADLGELMASIGASLGTAQGQLTQGTAIPTTRFAMSEATLELKVAVDQTGGKIRVATIGGDAISKGGIDAAALSTVTMRFVAFEANDLRAVAQPESDPEQPQDPAEPAKPKPARSLSKEEAIKALAERPDIKAALSKDQAIKFEAALQRSRQSWLVTALDAAGKMVGQGEVPRGGG